MTIVTERAVPADARAIAQIHVDAWRAAYAQILPAPFLAAQSVDAREAMWRDAITAGTSLVLVARDRTGVALRGWLSCGACRDDDAPADCAEIWAVYVDPHRWNAGCGRALWVQARQALRARGYARCSLWVFSRNERALRFYRSIGFALDAIAPRTFELGGATVEEVRLVAPLS